MALNTAFKSKQATRTRREFLGHTLHAGAGLWVLGGTATAAPQMPSGPRRGSPNDLLQIASIGAGGQGYWDIVSTGKRDDIVAIADVDFGMAYKAFKAFPKAKQ